MKIPHGTIVLVADGQKALLLCNEGDRKYSVLKTLSHEELTNPPARDLGSDRPGRSFSSAGTGRSSYANTDFHEQAEDRFANDAANTLANAAKAGEGGIVIIAPPRFLGRLRPHVKDVFGKRVLAEIGKDLVHHETDDIADAIAEH
jgi:protein required for attachment to host cells